MTFTQLYLFTVVLPNFSGFLTMTLILLCSGILIIGAVALSKWLSCDEDEILKLYNPLKYTIITACIVGLIGVCFPTEKQLYTLAGGYAVTNTKDVAKLPENVVKAANAWLEKAADSAADKSKDKK